MTTRENTIQPDRSGSTATTLSTKRQLLLHGGDAETYLVAAGILRRRFRPDELVTVGCPQDTDQSVRWFSWIIDNDTDSRQITANVSAARNEDYLPLGDEWILLHDSDFRVESFETPMANGGLIFEVRPLAPSSGPSKAEFRIHYNPELVDSSFVKQLADSYPAIVSQLCDVSDDQSITVLGMNLFGADEESKTIALGANMPTPSAKFFSRRPSAEFTFPFQFERQAKTTPDRIAIVDVTADEISESLQEWTYAELNQRANQIANWLIDQQLPLEAAVGVHLTRSPMMLATLIGIMKAGCCYVPLVSEMPSDRLGYMVSDSDIRFCVTEESQIDSARKMVTASGRDVSLLVIDHSAFVDDAGNSRHRNNPPSKIKSNNAAYVIYTSGSTGVPKGVQVEHHSFVNFCLATLEMLEFTERDKALAITTIAFDVSVAELFPLLLTGGTVAVAQEKVGANGEELSHVLAHVSVTYFCATPTSLRILMASGWGHNDQLTIITGGEPISRETVNALAPRCRRLVNGYGPTEATVYTTYGFLKSGTGPVPIGFTTLNLKTYVLDESGNLLPPFAPGELFVGGEGLARCYLNRNELTAERFVQDPFDPTGEGRIYATGDLSYRDHNGQLYCLGRKDFQVKIRGYRIELGEIETRLREHESVKDSVVMVREDRPDEKRLVAYIIWNQQPVPDSVLQDFLAETMPNYMVPAWFVPVAKFPRNASAKLDRKSFPTPEEAEQAATPEADSLLALAAGDKAKSQLANQIAEIWSKVIGRRIRIEDEVYRKGADSLLTVKFQIELESLTGIRVPVGKVFQSPTPLGLAEQLVPSSIKRTKSDNAIRFSRKQSQAKGNDNGSHEIAIVGMAGHFPGARNLDQYWQNLVDGVESIRDFTPEELLEAGVSPIEFRGSNYVPRGTIFEGAYDFDPGFFGITRSDAEILSPQFRLFMNVAWTALEQAGYPIEPDGLPIGVFAGAGYGNYLNASFDAPESQRLQVLIGNAPDYVATRAAFALGLTGPAVAIHAACSTSLVTVEMACQAIRQNRCSMAIAGGSSFSWPQGRGYQHGAGLIYSADGHCRAFDHRATGTIFGQGAGAVLLRPLSDALAAGDTIHAVIRGIATNNDGNRKGGFAAPSISGQADVIRMALEDGDVDPESISYVEAHGTGTKIGDPIEVAALKEAWEQTTERKQFCSIGSVKTNIGHCDAAAGIAGLLKVVLALKHQQLPATLNFEAENPEIKFADTPFYVQQELTKWQPETGPRIAAISSFGLGGTNAHAILSEPPSIEQPMQSANVKFNDSSSSKNSYRVLPFSARTASSLDAQFAVWPDYLASLPDDQFDNLAFTLREGRRQLKQRRFVIAKDIPSLAGSLESFEQTTAPLRHRNPVFLFTGQGSQYTNMGLESYRDEPVFREALNRCDAELKRIDDIGLLFWLYPSNTNRSTDEVDINQTEFAQLAQFCVSYSQAQLWMSWGFNPTAVAGHSIGEFAAATIAGVMTLPDALAIVQMRGRLMQAMDPGSMLAVFRNEAETRTLLKNCSNVEVATVNSSSITVVAGPTPSIEKLQTKCKASGIRTRLLRTSHAFHSSMMEPMLDEFRQFVLQFKLSPPRIPMQSNVSGEWLDADSPPRADYFASQIRSTVRFADNLRSAMQSEDPLLLLEMGAGTTLTQFAQTAIEELREESNDLDDRFEIEHFALATLPSAKEAASDGAASSASWCNKRALGRCWVNGQRIDWNKVESFSKNPSRIPMPTYQFDFETFKKESAGSSSSDRDPLVPETEWFHVPAWKQMRQLTPVSTPAVVSEEFDSVEAAQSVSLVFVPAVEQTRLATTQEVFSANEAGAILIVVGDHFAKTDTGYQLNPENLEDYRSLVRAIVDSELSISSIYHGWTLSHSRNTSLWKQLAGSAFSLIWLAQALDEIQLDRTVCLNVLTTGATDGQLPGDAPSRLVPAHHSLLGTLNVIQKEFPALTTKLVDVDLSWSEICDQLSPPSNERRLLGQSYTFNDLLQQEQHYPQIAWRDNRAWEQIFETIALNDSTIETESSTAVPTGLKSGGVYVVTGGLGDLALGMATNWAQQTIGLTFVLLARRHLPPRDQWTEILNEDIPGQPSLRSRIKSVQEIESLGSSVEILQVDCAVPEEIESAFTQILSAHKKINGILHTAGVLRDGVVATKTLGNLHAVYGPKALAAQTIADWSLNNAQALSSLDFIVLFSSISADLGLFGQVDYSGANNILDGLAQSFAQRGLPIVSINWPAFDGVGMAARTSESLKTDAALMNELAQNALFVDEGARAVSRIVLHQTVSRVVVSRKSFESRRQLAIADGRSVIRQQLTAGETNLDQATTREQMLVIWRDQFDNERIGVNDDFFELGGDSLFAVGLAGSIEQAFGKIMPISHLIAAPTVASLLKRMELVEPEGVSFAENADPSSESINHLYLENLAPVNFVKLRDGDPDISPLLLLHGADGAAMFYRDFAARLSTNRTIFGFESPLLSDPDFEIPETVEKLAETYVELLLRLQPSGPFLLAGYSFGGIAAYEMVARLEAAGQSVEKLLVYDIANPAKVEYRGALDRLKSFWERQDSDASPLRKSLRLTKRATQAIRERTKFEFENRVAATKSELDSQYWRHKKARERHMAIEEHYQPTAIEAPLRLVIANGNSSKYKVDKQMGWGDLATDLQTIHVEGSHLELFDQPFVEGMISATDEFLQD